MKRDNGGFTPEELVNEGFNESVSKCEQCGNHLWFRIIIKPHHWESDVSKITRIYRCVNCGTEIREYDSD